MTRPARFLVGTIIVGVLVLVVCAVLLRRGVATSAPADPFDAPAPAAPAAQTP